MKELKPIVKRALTAEFPRLSPNLIRGVIYLLFNDSEQKDRKLKEESERILSIDHAPPYSDEEINEVLTEILVKTGRDMCQNEDMLLIITSLVRKVAALILEKRSRGQSSKRKSEQEEEAQETPPGKRLRAPPPKP